MGQKVHPKGIRLGIVRDWDSNWYASSREFAAILGAELEARACINKELKLAGVSSVKFARLARNARITVHVARPGMIIGKSGKDVEALRNKINKILKVPVHISIEEVRKPELDAKLVAETVAQQLEKRVMFRRAMKRVVTTAMRLGAKGIKICVSGRLGGSEIARSEWYREGRVPLHTLRADIDYALAEAFTTYGVIGVKVWIFKGEVIGDKDPSDAASEKASAKQES
jgi:small subunit ribosomal protein S3